MPVSRTLKTKAVPSGTPVPPTLQTFSCPCGTAFVKRTCVVAPAASVAHTRFGWGCAQSASRSAGSTARPVTSVPPAAVLRHLDRRAVRELAGSRALAGGDGHGGRPRRRRCRAPRT